VDLQPQYRAALQPARLRLLDTTAAAASDPKRDATQRLLATNALVDFGRDQPELLARALVVSNQQQYPVVVEALRAQPRRAFAELKRQLDARPQRTWREGADISKFTAPPRGLVEKIENAAGIVHSHFALCQRLPSDEFAPLAESLAASGYRPVRLRPYSGNRCAVLWQRDGGQWQYRMGITAESLLAADREFRDQGLSPVDVAPYPASAELLYTALWGKDNATEARPFLEVGLRSSDLYSSRTAELVPCVLQGSLEPENHELRFAVIWRAKGAAEDVAVARGDEGDLEQGAANYSNRAALDIAAYQAPPPKNKRDLAEESLDRLDQQLVQKPDDPSLLMARGMAAVGARRDQQAIADLTKALEKNPRDVTGRRHLAIAYARLKDSDAVERELAEIGKLAGNTSTAAYSRAVILSALGKADEGLAELEQAVRTHATDHSYLLDAARAYALAAEDLEQTTPQTAAIGAEATARVARYQGRAIELLRLACDAGYSDGERLRLDYALESLRPIAGFQAILARLGAGRRYAAIWLGSKQTSPGDLNDVAANSVAAQPRESVESHGLDIQTHLARCKELAAAGYRPQSLAVLSETVTDAAASVNPRALETGVDEAASTASVWVRPHLSESALDESARRNALAAIGLLELGEREEAWRVLHHAGDPRARTYWIHHVQPLGLDPRTLIERLARTKDDQETFALLQTLGEYDRGEMPPESSRQVVDLAARLYRDSPRRELHAASRWLLNRWREERTVAEIDAGRTRGPVPVEGREWFTNAAGLTMVVVPAGEFWMGSPASEPERTLAETRHVVTITRPFAISDREIPVELYDRFHKEAFNDAYTYSEEFSPRRDNGPVLSVTWYGALAFCRWLSDQEGIPADANCLPPLEELLTAVNRANSGQSVSLAMPPDFAHRPGYRLPTEAEWEYACRAGVTTRYHFGNDAALLGRYAWFFDNSGQRTRSGGLLKPNDWGLFDMHGNVWEWCHDWGGGPHQASRATDPVGPATGRERLVHGGGWNDHSRFARCALRNVLAPSVRNINFGFRVVRIW
jgi:formylglycine-generating enzyme required for sulfatase activity/Flp pilus assembly protein TadD